MGGAVEAQGARVADLRVGTGGNEPAVSVGLAPLGLLRTPGARILGALVDVARVGAPHGAVHGRDLALGELGGLGGGQVAAHLAVGRELGAHQLGGRGRGLGALGEGARELEDSAGVGVEALVQRDGPDVLGSVGQGGGEVAVIPRVLGFTRTPRLHVSVEARAGLDLADEGGVGHVVRQVDGDRRAGGQLVLRGHGEAPVLHGTGDPVVGLEHARSLVGLGVEVRRDLRGVAVVRAGGDLVDGAVGVKGDIGGVHQIGVVGQDVRVEDRGGGPVGAARGGLVAVGGAGARGLVIVRGRGHGGACDQGGRERGAQSGCDGQLMHRFHRVPHVEGDSVSRILAVWAIIGPVSIGYMRTLIHER